MSFFHFEVGYISTKLQRNR